MNVHVHVFQKNAGTDETSYKSILRTYDIQSDARTSSISMNKILH